MKRNDNCIRSLQVVVFLPLIVYLPYSARFNVSHEVSWLLLHSRSIKCLLIT